MGENLPWDEPIRLRHDSDLKDEKREIEEAMKKASKVAEKRKVTRRTNPGSTSREKYDQKSRVKRSLHVKKLRRVDVMIATARAHPATAAGAVLALLGLLLLGCRRRRASASRRHAGRAKRDDFNRWDPRAGAAPSWAATALPPTVKRACQRGDKDAVLQWLKSNAANADARDSDARTALHHAAVSGHAELARALLESGASPDAVDQSKQTPLHAAAHAGSASAVRVLLDAGADVALDDSQSRTPLAVAQAAGNHGCARLIQRRERAIAKASSQTASDSLHLRHSAKLDAAL